MFSHLTHAAKAFLFFALALGLAVLAALFVTDSVFADLLLMSPPLVAVVVMLLVVSRDGYSKPAWLSLGVHRTGVRSWPLAVLIPLLVLGGSYGVVWLTGVAAFVPPTLPSAWSSLVVPVLLPVVGGLLASFLEEIGWRGYLVPQLLPYGVRRALLVSGLLHGLWHLPFLLLMSSYHGDGNRLIILPLFLLSLTAAGVFYGYLRVRTGSVWPAVIAHTAINTFWQTFSAFTVATSPLALEYLAGESGVLTLVGISVAAWWLLRRIAPPVRMARLSGAGAAAD